MIGKQFSIIYLDEGLKMYADLNRTVHEKNLTDILMFCRLQIYYLPSAPF
jgi:hypothetical protein